MGCPAAVKRRKTAMKETRAAEKLFSHATRLQAGNTGAVYCPLQSQRGGKNASACHSAPSRAGGITSSRNADFWLSWTGYNALPDSQFIDIVFS